MKFLTFVLAICFTVTTFAKKTLLSDVKLEWKATSDLSELAKMDLSKLSEDKLKLEKLTDARTIKPATRIGEYSEDKAEILPVDTTSDVSEFVTSGFQSTLKKAGLEIVDSGQQYTLSGQIKEFYVTETNTYQGNVLIKFTLKKGDKVVWTGPIQGTNSRFGRTYKLDNYLESLSDSVLEASVNLLKNESFKKAFN